MRSEIQAWISIVDMQLLLQPSQKQLNINAMMKLLFSFFCCIAAGAGVSGGGFWLSSIAFLIW